MRIVLAYAGGLTATAAIPWLRERYRADVVAVTLDLGQGRALESVRDRALAAGAVRAHVVDARETFAQQVLVPALRADVDSVTPRVLGEAVLGPVLVDVARIERAVAVAHTCEADGADRTRLESPVRALNPSLTIIPVAAERPLAADELAAFARAHQLTTPREAGLSVVTDVNLWGRTLTPTQDGDALPLPERAFTMTRSSANCPSEPAIVELEFAGGVPVSINGVAMPFLDLLQSLVTIAGTHGIGRRQVGSEWVETPAASVLHFAHRALQERLWDADTRAFAATVSRRDTDLLEQGGWSFPLRDALDAFVIEAQKRITGTVRVTLAQGNMSAAPSAPAPPPNHDASAPDQRPTTKTNA